MHLISLTNKQKEEHQKWKTLFEEKYLLCFEEPSYEQVPFVSNLVESSQAKKRLERIEYYLLGSYAINMGSNIHKEMHDIRQKFTKEEYQWHQLHNKLGLNKWGTIAGVTLASLNLALQRNDLHILSKFPLNKAYSEMSFEEKKEYVKSIDSKLYEILETIYSQYK